eukprot:CAMPEP_0194055562 /NCGR_PEP_ID=MMETSP0009_2-20130614/57193_1 /TAXON_ID=210454 /ORGANISM="Grammatophora oceanica, Strain CCMP 410" /LENGTH=48 /DNA_ID= /DNA_START= /DNA_END= /DNA_ORIENTATION=
MALPTPERNPEAAFKLVFQPPLLSVAVVVDDDDDDCCGVFSAGEDMMM